MRILTLLFLVFLSPALAWAGPLEDAQTAYDRADFQTSFKLRQELADQGNPKAQYQLGWMYLHGNGVEKNLADAIKWFTKGAENGSPDAQGQIGFMYYQGIGLKCDYSLAAKWWKKAAERGKFDAQWNLGGLFEIGKGVKKNQVQAYKWYSLALNNGNGIGDTPGVGRTRQKQQLGELSKKMTMKEIKEANRLAATWKPTPAPSSVCRPNKHGLDFCGPGGLLFVTDSCATGTCTAGSADHRQ